MRSPSTGTVEDFSSALFRAGHLGNTPLISMSVGGLRMAHEFAHEPVLAQEVSDAFAVVPSGFVIDATVGGGGHSAALLEGFSGISVLGLDRDEEALGAARARLSSYGARVQLHHARFSDLLEVVEESGIAGSVNGVLFDLGVSSYQLDRADRGFSYRQSGPLDMRMDQGRGSSAAELVNGATEGELTALFAANGEGRLARRIARAVISARPISSTTELADVVAAAVPAPARRRGHPARRVFQALRIAVNTELDELARALPDALDVVGVGGRVVAISYHSGEDRLVKSVFADAASGGCTCPPSLPCVCGARAEFRLVFRGSHKPTEVEVQRNPRSKSARLRVIERILAQSETAQVGGA
jgi:16S rRNA (cytosine1402-N4)-methyltransferase